jgi:hypothetical protein
MATNSPSSRKTAAVTGAASGIGLAYCIALAGRGFDLILIDRAAAAAAELAARLRREYPAIAAEICVADLTDTTDLDRTAALLAACGTLELLVNGAGFGTKEIFTETIPATQQKMIDLHVKASVALARAALPGMVARNSGGIINIASVAALVRFPGQCTYTATKMFLVAFSECLAVELDQMGASNVRVQALCPGNTHTSFNDTETMRGYDPGRMPEFMWMTPDRLVELSLGALERGSGTYIPLLRNRVYCFVFGTPIMIRTLRFLRKTGITEKIMGLLGRRKG